MEQWPPVTLRSANSAWSLKMRYKMAAAQNSQQSPLMTTAPISFDVATRRQANSLRPVSRLPNELLVIIFRLAKLGRWKTASSVAKSRWTDILCVCHRWYEVGVSTPSLWTTIGFGLYGGNGMEYTKEVLRRSRGLPLDVYANFDPDSHPEDTQDEPMEQRKMSYDEISSELITVMPRIQSLDLSAGRDFLEDFEAQESPRLLEVLKLWCHGSYCLTRPFNIGAGWLSSSSLPRLRELTLCTEGSIYGILRAPVLRKLNIATCEDDGPYNPDLGRFYNDCQYALLESLRYMPLLEEFSFQSDFPDDDSETPDTDLPTDIVHLQNLKSFELIHSPPDFARFLDRVSFPAGTTFSATCLTFDRLKIEESVAALRRKVMFPPAGERSEIYALSVTAAPDHVFDRRCLQFEAFTHPVDCLCNYDPGHSPTQSTHPRPLISIGLSYIDDEDLPWDGLDGLAEMLSCFPLNEVRLLRVQTRDAYNGLKAHLGLLDSKDVAHAPAPLEGVRHFTLPTAPSGWAEEPELCHSELLQSIRRLMPNLIAVCLDLSPQERTLESENRRGGSWSNADDQAVEPPEPSCPDDCPHCHAYDEYDYYGSDVDEREPEAY